MNTTMNTLIQALVDGDHTAALDCTKPLLAAGISPQQIVIEGIQPAMEALDSKCTVEQFNLLEIMLAGRAVSMVTQKLFDGEYSPPHPKATIVVASLEGDIHDVGKHILKMVLLGNAYRVVDCGKDTPVAQVVETVAQETAGAVCVSGLITSVIPQVQTLKAALTAREQGHVKVLAGGAALKQAAAENLRVDFVGQTAFDAPHYLDQLMRTAA